MDAPTLGDWIPNLLRGLEVTLTAAALGSLLMLVLSFVLGMAVRTGTLWLRGPARVVVEFFRGTSLLIQLWWLFFALPQLLGIRYDAVLVGAIAFGLNYGAYGSEVVRGSLNAIPAAQWEAATALNMSSWQRMRRVVLPQAVALMIPPFNNLLIQLLKSTPLLFSIALFDLVAAANAFRNLGGSTLVIYGALLAIYLALAYAVTLVMNLLEALVRARLGRSVGLRQTVRSLRPGTKVEEVA